MSPLVELSMLVLVFQLLMVVELVCFGHLDHHLMMLLGPLLLLDRHLLLLLERMQLDRHMMLII
jgi:hypothetical protein